MSLTLIKTRQLCSRHIFISVQIKIKISEMVFGNKYQSFLLVILKGYF